MHYSGSNVLYGGDRSCLKKTAEPVSGTVYIELAGAAKKFEINYKVWQDERQVVHLVGNQRIRFSDFGLVSPKRMGGVVRANDVLDVEFHVSCRVVGKVAK